MVKIEKDISMSMAISSKQAIRAGWKMLWLGLWYYVRRKDAIITTYYTGNRGHNA